MVARTRTLGVIADEILKNKAEVKVLEDKKKLLEEKRHTLEAELILAAAKENLTLGGGKKSKWKIEPSTVPQAADWDEFYKFMVKKGYFHLLQKRLAVLACREIWELGDDIPGVEKFTKNVVRVTES